MMLTGILTIDQLEVENKTVLMRVDFNVPRDKNGEIRDDTRIQAALPSIKYLREHNAKVVLCSHLGRPKNGFDANFSMVKVGERLAELLNCEVIVPEELVGEETKKLIDEMKPNQVMLLENLRFEPGEKKGSQDFGNDLAALADLYVNDAFGVSHRKDASVYATVKNFHRRHKAAGFLMAKEIEALTKLMKSPKKPFVALMGGAKVSDKIGVIRSLLSKADVVIIGGAMAYTFLKSQGLEVGKSMVEDQELDVAKQTLIEAQSLGKKILLPIDHVCAPTFDTTNEDDTVITTSQEIPKAFMGLDIGPQTIELYSEVIKKGETIFWNGPMGVFENNLFSKGTCAMAQAIADSNANYSVVGGGDSVAALNKTGLEDSITHVSTGGGASLQWIEGEPLPGVEALKANHPFE